MISEAEFIFSPNQISNENYIRKTISEKFKISLSEINEVRITHRSIDTRKSPKYLVKLIFSTNSDKLPALVKPITFKNVSEAEEVVIIGAGPAGYFAALQCLQSGLRPVIFERGKSVDERKFDISNINSGKSLNPESNYAFGEGGAGTYSDGKLYTRSKKRGSVDDVLQMLYYFGANEDLFVNARPHIGTDKLHSIMLNIRLKIEVCGGSVNFNSKLTKIIVEDSAVKAVVINDDQEYRCKNLILATGHSARDVYYMLSQSGIALQEKGFAMGVRVEHPQELIDSIQYKGAGRGNLPAAAYNLVTQVDGRGVYSFCMCPGGNIVCAISDEESMVVNGMSNSKRNSPFANSGIVVEIRPEDCTSYSEDKIFAGLEFQKMYEQTAFRNCGGRFVAPAQRLSDFVSGKLSANLPKCSYRPGVVSSPMHFWLPEFIGKRLQNGFKDFGRKMHGYLTNEALIVGVESRTSSPIKILRDAETYQSVSVKNLYPCGEGAGYAGGIVSSAIDGIEIVKKISEKA